MKKFFALVLSIVMVLSATACANGTEAPPAASGAASTASKASGTINVFGWGSGSEMASYKAIAEKFNTQNNGVKANIEIIPSTDYATKLKAMLAAGTAPDVIMTGIDDNHFYYLNNNFEDVNPYIERDKFDLGGIFVPGSTDGYVYLDGARWGLPLVANTLVIAYNKEYFDRYGVAYPTGDWDWDEFLAACKKLTGGEGDAKEYALTYHWVTTSLAHYSAGGKLFDLTANPPKLMADDPRTIKGVEMYANLIKEGYYPDSAAVQNMPSETRFFSGKCGMTFFFPWDIANFSESLDGAFKWDLAPLPKDAVGTSTTLQWNTGYAMNSASKNKDAAWEFMKFACGSAESAEIVSASGIPVVQSVAAEYGKKTIPNTEISQQIFVDVMPASKAQILGGAFNALGDLYYAAWNDIIYKNADAATRMAQLQKEGEPVLAELTSKK